MASTPADEPARELPQQSALFYETLRNSSWAVMKLAFRLTAKGVDNVPREGGIVLAPTHRSNWDTFVAAVPLRHRRLRPMAKIELYENALLGKIITAGGAFPVRRNETDQEAIDTAIALLHAGETLLMYPEGTRVRDGEPRVQTGAARLALMGDAALVPALITGTDRVRAWPPRLPHFEVRYGLPIPMDDLRASDDQRRASYEATKRWKDVIAAMRERAAQGG